jgi:hypothetical protein
VFKERLDLADVRGERTLFPLDRMRTAKVLTDDFAPVEFLDTLKANISDAIKKR